jgi:hypothetical protein
MIVAISGTRNRLTTAQEGVVYESIRWVSEHFRPSDWRVGDATGVDEFVRGVMSSASKYVAEWNKHGDAAGPIRNRAMLTTPTKADLLLAFPVRGTRGTKDCIEQALRYRIDVLVTWLDRPVEQLLDETSERP